MSRYVSAIALVFMIGFLTQPLAAQDALVSPRAPYGILSKENVIALEKIVVLKKLEPKEMPKHLYYNFDEFLNKAVQWPRLDLLIKERIEQPEQNRVAVSREAFCAYFNTRKVSEEKLLRQEWAKTFGMDVWYPYYKAKEVEDWVKERCSVRVFKMKGKPEFSKRGFTYVFKTRF